MSSFSDWKVPSAFQPKSDEYLFDLESALASVLYLSSVVPENAFSAATLGTERAGNAVLIGESGLVLTVGYLVNEAQSIWLRTGDGKVMPADVVGLDHTTGFALVQALGRLDIPAIPLGDSDSVQIGDEVVLAGAGGPKRSVGAHVAARQPFAGYWEYLLDSAIFTAPSHPNWGGAALIGPTGALVGIGSLQLEQERRKGISETINMSIPINLLKPVLDDILTMGQPNRPPRPWLGVYATEIEGKVVLMGVADRSPAKRAELRTGDIILSINGAPVVNLASFFKRLWALGTAGVEAPLSILRDGRTLDMRVVSADRNRIANNPRLH
jgi:S1-C subfamily serine protease